jgi:calmodulin
MKFLSDTEVSQTVKKAADSSNTIDFANFLVVMTRHLKGEAPIEEISEAFRVFDKNNNGHMSADEFKKMMVSGLQFTAEDAEEILKEANVDNDGDFDYEAFVQKLAKSR